MACGRHTACDLRRRRRRRRRHAHAPVAFTHTDSYGGVLRQVKPGGQHDCRPQHTALAIPGQHPYPGPLYSTEQQVPLEPHATGVPAGHVLLAAAPGRTCSCSGVAGSTCKARTSSGAAAVAAAAASMRACAMKGYGPALRLSRKAAAAAATQQRVCMRARDAAGCTGRCTAARARTLARALPRGCAGQLAGVGLWCCVGVDSAAACRVRVTKASGSAFSA